MRSPNQPSSVTVCLGGQTYEVVRARLGIFFHLETHRKRNDVVGYFKVLHLPVDCDALESLYAYEKILELNVLRELPLLEKPVKGKDIPWDYNDRWSYNWVHLVALYYHWSYTEIVHLDPDDFFAFVQEILVEQQLHKEWDWLLHPEVSYQYSQDGKSRHFKPLDRPEWMTEPLEEKWKHPPIPQDLMPVGASVTSVYDQRSSNLPRSSGL